MYNRIPQKKKPASDKLIRQLVCYLYLEFIKQARLEQFVGQEEPGSDFKRRIDSKRRTYCRYVQEILECLEISGETLETEWFIFYSKGTFYRGEDFFLHPNKDGFSFEVARQILPVTSSSDHMLRLRQTIRLAKSIVIDMEKKYHHDLIPAQYFQAVFWPMHKHFYRKKLIRDARIMDECDLLLRTVQRDLNAVAIAVVQFYQMSDAEEKAFSLQRMQKSD